MTAHLIVRATVADPRDRSGFDVWYEDDHMAAVIERFAPLRCWRSWSALDPSRHYACYEFEDIDQLEAMMSTTEFDALVSDFTRTWQGKVTRERDVLETVQSFERAAAPLV